MLHARVTASDAPRRANSPDPAMTKGPDKHLIPASAVTRNSATPDVLTIDSKDLEQPPYFGFVNRCAVTENEGFFEFVFWEHVNKSTQRAGARFYISDEDFIRGVWPQWQSLLARIRVDGAIGFKTDYRVEAEVVIRPEGAAPLANLLPLARSGTDATFDVHYVSPRAVFEQKKSKDRPVIISPLFSLAIPTGLLLAILEYAEKLVPSLQAAVDSYAKK